MVEAVIGIGKNLFYNSPMEACILVCRSRKPSERKGKVLFINARNEVTRKNAESYLEDTHIDKIATAYKKFNTTDGFSSVATIDEIEANDFKLSIALYVRGGTGTDDVSIEDATSEWMDSSAKMHAEYLALNALIKAGDDDETL